MSSHREAPEISKDPVADSTDVQHELTYQFRFQTQTVNPNSFLYNTGQITSINSPNWNRPQFYTVTRVDYNGNSTVLTSTPLACPPCNIGPRSTPNYQQLAGAAVHNLPGGGRVFAGQRAEGFYVDLGSIFDLADLRPFQNLHLIPTPAQPGVNGTEGYNVHSIALQVPKKLLTSNGSNPTDPNDPRSVIGVYTSASRQKSTIINGNGTFTETGPFKQVSRLGEPLINEVIIPLGQKDFWNAVDPQGDSQFDQYYDRPELAKLLPV